MFANFHRLSAETYKAMELELFTGAASPDGRVQRHRARSPTSARSSPGWSCTPRPSRPWAGPRWSTAWAKRAPTSSIPNPMIANICKFYFADNWHTATKYIQDIGGGIIVTAPSSKDFYNPETHDFMEKYFGGKAGRADRAPAAHGQAHPRPHLLLRGRAHHPRRRARWRRRRCPSSSWPTWGRYTAAAMRAAGIPGAEKHPVFAELPEFPPAL